MLSGKEEGEDGRKRSVEACSPAAHPAPRGGTLQTAPCLHHNPYLRTSATGVSHLRRVSPQACLTSPIPLLDPVYFLQPRSFLSFSSRGILRPRGKLWLTFTTSRDDRGRRGCKTSIHVRYSRCFCAREWEGRSRALPLRGAARQRHATARQGTPRHASARIGTSAHLAGHKSVYGAESIAKI